jgi:hypothetical protein
MSRWQCSAAACSLLVVALQSAAGFAGQLGTAALDWPLTLGVTGRPCSAVANVR